MVARAHPAAEDLARDPVVPRGDDDPSTLSAPRREIVTAAADGASEGGRAP